MKQLLISIMLLGMTSLSAMAQGIVVHQTNSEKTTFKTSDVSRIEFTENQVESTSSNYATKEEVKAGLDTKADKTALDAKADKTELAVKANQSALEQALTRVASLEAMVEVLKKEIGYKPGPPGVVAVDLGLPSGIKWANMNVGASKPEEGGGFYAWGEMEQKDDYHWDSYKLCKGDQDKLTKYCLSSSCGTVDNKRVLDPEDDIAHVKWGGTWCMPTDENFTELRTKCTWTWDPTNKGYTVVGPNGKSIFLPAVGYRSGGSFYDGGSDGNYWSTELGSIGSSYASGLCFNKGNVGKTNSNRCCGLSVRPVCK